MQTGKSCLKSILIWETAQDTLSGEIGHKIVYRIIFSMKKTNMLSLHDEITGGVIFLFVLPEKHVFRIQKLLCKRQWCPRNSTEFDTNHQHVIPGLLEKEKASMARRDRISQRGGQRLRKL